MRLPESSFIERAFPSLSNTSRIAVGGQKAVYRACSVDHGEVVLKLTSPDERAIREIDAVTSGQFSNVPKIFEHGTVRDGAHAYLYLIEQRIEGETLQGRLSRDGLLPVSDVLALLEMLLTTTVEIDDQHLVHRDIKPANIMVGHDGRFWLLDFGIARHLDKDSLTQTADHFGPATIGYAPPEQLRNVKAEVDIRADLFAVGLVSYECLAGHNPFVNGARTVMDVLKRISTNHAPALNIPGDTKSQLAAFIATLMARSATLRPQSAAQALEWFRELRPTITS